MNLSLRARLWVLLCLALTAAPAAAQTDTPSPAPPPPPAHVSSLDGTVAFERDGQREPASAGMPVAPGDRLRTDAGRAEILFADGTALHLDVNTTADVLAADLIRLIDGRIYIRVAGARDPSRAVRYQVDAPAASVETHWPGQYRVAASNGLVELAVVAGEGTLATDLGAVTVRAGERAVAQEGQAPSPPQYFNSARWDAFDRWSAVRRDDRIGTTSSQYLPSELQVYGSTFDRYGSWRTEPDVGNVWVPTVEADWRPYYYGYWRPYPTWGSVWIGYDPWAYPTHHYGRWGFSLSFGWYWAPTSVWGSAWVYWGSSAGYVSWCPLGYHGGPVFGHWGVHGPRYDRYVDPWRGWTVVPRHAFGGRIPVHRAAIDGHRLGPGARGAFVAHRTPPPIEYAVARGTGGLGGPGAPSAAGPRGPQGGGLPAIGVRPGGAPRSIPALGSMGQDGAVRRFGRGDGTGLERSRESIPLDRGNGAAWRRAVPGSVGAAGGRALSPADEAARIFAGGRPTRTWGGSTSAMPTPSDAMRAGPSPSEVFRSRPTPSDVMRARPTPSEVFRPRPSPGDAAGARPRREPSSASSAGASPSEFVRRTFPWSQDSGRRNETPPPSSAWRSRPTPSSGTTPRDEPRSEARSSGSPYGGGWRSPSSSGGGPSERPAYRGGGMPRESAPPSRYNSGTPRSSSGSPSGGHARQRPPRDP